MSMMAFDKRQEVFKRSLESEGSYEKEFSNTNRILISIAVSLRRIAGNLESIDTSLVETR